MSPLASVLMFFGLILAITGAATPAIIAGVFGVAFEAAITIYTTMNAT